MKKLNFTTLLFMFLLLIIVMSCKKSNDTPIFSFHTDSLALVDLYKATNGGSWNNNTNWLVNGQRVSTWQGVTVSNGRVTQLNFNFNNLVGTIPSSIGNLTQLTSLEFGVNQLTGSIPSSIGNLTALTSLNFGTNQLSGSIPTEINKLTALNQLYLDNNSFTFAGMEAIVPMFSNLPSNQFIYAPQNNINITQQGNTLSVSAGGTLANNTYTWYKDGNVMATQKGDSTYTATGSGTYHVVVANGIATNLTLTSNDITL